jgi:hypothetical protein
VVAQEHAPRRARRHVDLLGQDALELDGALRAQGVEDARHRREVEGHVALGLLGGAEVGGGLGRPLVRLGDQHPAGVLVVDEPSQLLEVLVRGGLGLAVAALRLVEVGDRVEPDRIDAEVEPEAQHAFDRRVHGRVLEVEVGLVREEAVPVELPSHGVEGPVRHLRVDEDDAGVGIALVRVAPHVEVAERAVRILPRRQEPGVLVGGVVDREIDHHPHVPRVRLGDDVAEVVDRAVLGQHPREVRDVVAAVAQRRAVEGRHPDGIDAEPLQVVELRGEPLEVAEPVAVRVDERAHHHFVEHALAVPVAIEREPRDVRPDDRDGRGEAGGEAHGRSRSGGAVDERMTSTGA